MATPLTAEEEARYSSIIDDILVDADLATVTRKKIRSGLESALGGVDLSEQKYAIKALIEARFDTMSSQAAAAAEEEVSLTPAKRSASSQEEDADGDAGGDEDDAAPPAKKVKRVKTIQDQDARLAAQLQAEENSLARHRTTRGGGPTKVTKPKPKTTKKKKKSTSKVKAEDDSDLDGSEEATPKRKATGGFQKPFNLSYALAELCGEQQLSRPQVVKKIWEHIKANNLQDPSDKRQIICDEKMQAVFKQNRVQMFSMNKMLGAQLYPIEAEE